MKPVYIALIIVGLSITPALAQREQNRDSQRERQGIRENRHQTISWSGRVDNVVDVYFRESRSWVKRLSGYEGKGDARFSDPLPRKEIRLSLDQNEGRGKVTIRQRPNRRNGYTCIVRIEDKRPSVDSYRFTLSWDN